LLSECFKLTKPDGELEGFRETEGSPWKLFRWSVHALRDRRPATERSSEDAASPTREAQDYQDRIETLARELGRLEGEIRIRTELSEITESTLRESLERERERADKAEAALEAERSKGFWQRLFGGYYRAR
jgi:predicted  nucleic acid-binding Zn-ribbon protein